jgi:hypothetical protein
LRRKCAPSEPFSQAEKFPEKKQPDRDWQKKYLANTITYVWANPLASGKALAYIREAANFQTQT